MRNPSLEPAPGERDPVRGATPMGSGGPDRSPFASTSLARHLARGAVGFGLIGAAFALVPAVGPAALALAPGGLIALRGCPACWTIGLVETVSAGRLRRACADGHCELRVGGAAATIGGVPGSAGE